MTVTRRPAPASGDALVGAANRRTHNAGFALVEVMVACALLVAVAVGVSHLVAVAIRAGFVARSRTTATVLAVQKMEQLRSLKWSDVVDEASGITFPLSDFSTDLSTDPATDSGPGLSPSPDSSLDANTPPYVDYLDTAGRWVGRGTTPPSTAAYIRRWSIRPLESDPGNTLVFQVLVTTSRQPRDPAHRNVRQADEARLVCVKTRRAP